MNSASDIGSSYEANRRFRSTPLVEVCYRLYSKNFLRKKEKIIVELIGRSHLFSCAYFESVFRGKGKARGFQKVCVLSP